MPENVRVDSSLSIEIIAEELFDLEDGEYYFIIGEGKESVIKYIAPNESFSETLCRMDRSS